MQSACALLSYVACPAVQMFPNYLIKGKILDKKSYWTQNVFRFPLQLLSETFFIPKKNPRKNDHKCVWIAIWSAPYSCQILMKLDFRTQISNFMKIRAAGAKFFPCGRTDRQTYGQVWRSSKSLFIIFLTPPQRKFLMKKEHLIVICIFSPLRQSDAYECKISQCWIIHSRLPCRVQADPDSALSLHCATDSHNIPQPVSHNPFWMTTASTGLFAVRHYTHRLHAHTVWPTDPLTHYLTTSVLIGGFVPPLNTVQLVYTTIRISVQWSCPTAEMSWQCVLHTFCG